MRLWRSVLAGLLVTCEPTRCGPNDVDRWTRRVSAVLSRGTAICCARMAFAPVELAGNRRADQARAPPQTQLPARTAHG